MDDPPYDARPLFPARRRSESGRTRGASPDASDASPDASPDAVARAARLLPAAEDGCPPWREPWLLDRQVRRQRTGVLPDTGSLRVVHGCLAAWQGSPSARFGRVIVGLARRRSADVSLDELAAAWNRYVAALGRQVADTVVVQRATIMTDEGRLVRDGGAVLTALDPPTVPVSRAVRAIDVRQFGHYVAHRLGQRNCLVELGAGTTVSYWLTVYPNVPDCMQELERAEEEGAAGAGDAGGDPPRR